MKRRLLCLAPALVIAACGPTVTLKGDLNGVPVNVALGNTHTPTPQPVFVPREEPLPGFPPVLSTPPVYTPSNVPLPSPAACPMAPANAYPAVAATPSITSAPVAAAYPFHYVATVTETQPGGKTKVTQLPATGTRTIANVNSPATDGSFHFDVVESFDNVQTTTTLAVVPNSVVAALPPPTSDEGIFITKVVTQTASGTDTFAPAGSGVLVMPLPAAPGTPFAGSGTDGADSTSMSVQGTLAARARVDACGTLLDSWQVNLNETSGNARGGPSGSSQSQVTLDFATQYGGLPIAEQIAQNYVCADGNPCALSESVTISEVPQGG